MEKTESWAIFYKGKIIPIGDQTIQWIRQDPTEVWGWFDLELMLAWKNIFPLTEESRGLGYLPLKNKAWEIMPNPWWQFLTDRPVVHALPAASSISLETKSEMRSSEKFLIEVEKKWVDLMITKRKIL